MTSPAPVLACNIKALAGNWTAGFALDKHTLRSTFLGYNDYGHPEFETQRSEVGEALFRLKYRQGFDQIPILANTVAGQILPRIGTVGLIVPMPPTKQRQRQPVIELAREVSRITGVPVFESLLTKRPADAGAPQVKNLPSKAEKVEALKGRFGIHDEITNQGRWNALLIDDLYDSGASMEAACAVLKTYPKIGNVYVAALTWK